VESWSEWSSQGPLEEAARAELRLLPAAFAHLYRVAPTLELPKKLQGSLRANFCKTTLLADGSLSLISELSRHAPVMLTKGLAICLRFNAWASRPMVDVDIHVPVEALGNACRVLAELNWTPRYGMTWDSLLRRCCSRRNSWNFTKGTADVDLHWRLCDGRTNRWLEQEMWDSGEQVNFSGRTLLIQRAEFALLSSVNHGFLHGTRSDLLQTIVDSAWLLPLCKSNDLLRLIRRSELLVPFRVLHRILDVVGLSELFTARLIEGPYERSEKVVVRRLFKRTAESSFLREPFPYRVWKWLKRVLLSGTRPLATESALLQHPVLYRLWDVLGRKARLERLILKWTGPFSKPLKPAHIKGAYDLRDCTTIDEIGGPGWSYPDPARICCWVDRADARLLVPLKHVADYLLLVSVATNEPSPIGPIDVFANGLYVMKMDPSKTSSDTYSITITHRMLFGPWVELSFRPKPYSSGRSVPLRKLRILDVRRVTEILSAPASPVD
jgi:hypothetical protein